jgi:hypothetical protein
VWHLASVRGVVLEQPFLQADGSQDTPQYNYYFSDSSVFLSGNWIFQHLWRKALDPQMFLTAVSIEE